MYATNLFVLQYALVHLSTPFLKASKLLPSGSPTLSYGWFQSFKLRHTDAIKTTATTEQDDERVDGIRSETIVDWFENFGKRSREKQCVPLLV